MLLKANKAAWMGAKMALSILLRSMGILTEEVEAFGLQIVK